MDLLFQPVTDKLPFYLQCLCQKSVVYVDSKAAHQDFLKVVGDRSVNYIFTKVNNLQPCFFFFWSFVAAFLLYLSLSCFHMIIVTFLMRDFLSISPQVSLPNDSNCVEEILRVSWIDSLFLQHPNYVLSTYSVPFYTQWHFTVMRRVCFNREAPLH